MGLQWYKLVTAWHRAMANQRYRLTTACHRTGSVAQVEDSLAQGYERSVYRLITIRHRVMADWCYRFVTLGTGLWWTDEKGDGDGLAED